MGSLREIAFKDIASITIRKSILENLQDAESLSFIDELVAVRLSELNIDSSTKIKYNCDIEAITCEILTEEISVKKHNNIESAIEYSINSLCDISIIQGDNLVLVEQLNQNLYWTLENSNKLIKYS